MRIGLLGGSFNPAHDGHRLISLIALARLELDAVWWIVSPGNPLKSHDDLAPLEVRRQTAAALADHPRIVVTGFEAAFASPYSVTTLAELTRRLPDRAFVWLMGADNLAEFHRWKQWRKIAQMVPIAVFDRPGWHHRAVSSRAARRLDRARRPVEMAALLARCDPPAWMLLFGRRSHLASRDLRSRCSG